MRAVIPILLIIGLLSISVPGQLADGDLIVSQLYSANALGGFTVAVRPSDGLWTTIVPPLNGHFHNWVRMAANNNDLMIAGAETSQMKSGVLANATPGGIITTIARLPGTPPHGFGLDHDGAWIVIGTATAWSVSGSTVTTLYPSPHGIINGLAIDRDPGGATYVLGMAHNSTIVNTGKLYTADRSGFINTLISGVGYPLLGISGVELDAETGNYVISAGKAPPFLTIVAKDGTTLKTISSSTMKGANGVRVCADGTAWVCAVNNLTQVDLRTGAITRSITINIPSPGRFMATAVEIYGSRRLVCKQIGKTVTVDLKSQRPSDSHQPYYIACSFARRPAINLGLPARLCLAADPLFFLSATGQAPGIFKKFQGTTNQSAAATATVAIPAALPRLNVTVFVAGLIMNPGNPTVTNTHWFVL